MRLKVKSLLVAREQQVEITLSEHIVLQLVLVSSVTAHINKKPKGAHL